MISRRCRRRTPWLLAAVIAAAQALRPHGGARGQSALEDLRVLEREAQAAIALAREAFVFLDGGSGFLISEDGYVLTNAHVIASGGEVDGTRYRAHLVGGKPVMATLVGRDPEGDVALLKLDEKPAVRPLVLGDSEALRVGQRVLALGDPFLIASVSLFLERPPPDYEPSASLGIVSAVHRFSDTYTDAIQLDAALNRGNSGGPLLTLDGKVVGINGKIEMRFDNGTNTGVGYAIPMSQVERFLEPLKQAGGGIVRHGVVFGLELAERGDENGLRVTRIKGGSAAEMAGLRESDLLLTINGQPVRSRLRFHGIAGTYPAGSELKLRLRRNDREIETSVPLVEPGPLPWLGIKIESVDATNGGARVTKVVPGSPAERSGLQVKDVIVKLGDKPILSDSDLELNILTRTVGELVNVSVLRDGKPLELQMRVGGRSK